MGSVCIRHWWSQQDSHPALIEAATDLDSNNVCLMTRLFLGEKKFSCKPIYFN
jgi:hypothetical protein